MSVTRVMPSPTKRAAFALAIALATAALPGTLLAAPADPAHLALLEGRHADAEEALAARAGANERDVETAILLAALLEARGDADGAAATLARALKAGVPDAVAAGALSRLATLAPRTGDGGASVVDAFVRIATGEVPAVDPEVRSVATLAAGETLVRTGEMDRALALFDEHSGRVRPWTILGPYGRFPTIDMSRPHPPEAGDLSPRGAALGPSREPTVRMDTVFPDGRAVVLPQIPSAGVVYLVADLVASEATTIRLRVSSPQPYQAYLDGALVLDRDLTTAHPPLALAALVELDAGRHRLLVKLPNERPWATVSASVEAPAGGRATAVRAEPVRDELPLSRSRAQAAPVALDATDIAALRDDPARAIAAAWWLRGRDLDRESGRILETVYEAYPRAALIAYLLGEHAKNASTGASAAEDLSRARQFFDRALEIDPRLVHAHLHTAQIDESAGRASEAWELAARVLDEMPADPDALYLQARLAGRRGFAWQSRRLIARAREAAPGRLDLLEAEIAVLRQTDGIAELERALRERAERDPYDTDWAEALSATGRVEEALAAWDAVIARRPGSLLPRLGRARLLADAGRLDEALAALDRLRDLHPHEPLIAERRAAVLAALGRDADAEDELRRTLALDPSRLDVRATLEVRAGETLGGGWLADVDELVRAAAEAPKGVDSALLSDVAVVHVDARGGQTEVYQGVHAIYTLDGVEAESDVPVQPGALVEGVRIHKKDGRTVDVALPSRPPFSLPGLEPGDVVEYVWRRYIPPMRVAPGALDNSSIFLFQGPERDYVLSRYVVTHDAGIELEVCGNESGLETQRIEKDGLVTRIWTGRDMQRLGLEPHLPDQTEITPHVRLGMNLSWSDVGDVLRQPLLEAMLPDPPLPELAALVRERAGSEDAAALARALHEVVAERIAPVGRTLDLGAAASASASAGEGNRAGITLALARLLGLDARLVLARPVEFLDRELQCATTFAFPYVVVEIRAGERSYFLDHNDVNHVFDTIPPRFSGSDALVVPLDPAEPAAVARLPVREPDFLEDLAADATIDAEGSISGTLRLTVRGSLAAVLRKVVREVPQERRSLVYQSVVSNSFPGARVIASAATGLEADSGDVVLDIGFVEGSFGRRTPTGIALPLVASPLGVFSEYAGQPGRRFALLFDMQEFRRDTMRLRIPDGLVLDDMPASLDLATDFGSYDLRVSRDGDHLVVLREVRLPPRRIEPGAYDDFRDFAGAIDEAERKELLLRTPGL